MSPRSRRYIREGRFSSLRRWEYVLVCSSGISFVALLWTLSISFWSPLDWGPQILLPNSRCGLIRVLKSSGSYSLLRLANDFLMIPRSLLAFATAAEVYNYLDLIIIWMITSIRSAQWPKYSLHSQNPTEHKMIWVVAAPRNPDNQTYYIVYYSQCQGIMTPFSNSY